MTDVDFGARPLGKWSEGPSQNKITVRLHSTLYGRTYVEHSSYREAGADYEMNLGFRTPPDPEAYYYGLLGVKIIPYSLK